MWLPENGKAAPSLKFIQFFSAGTNHVAQHPIYTDSKIPLCSANGVHGPQIAEWVIMMDLVHSHKFPKLYDLQKEKTWNQKAGMDISDRVGKRVGILGYGSIGRQGMFVLIFSSFQDERCIWWEHGLHTSSIARTLAIWADASNTPGTTVPLKRA
jgi:lactate dehydrogenase-like 2-hydroxyacid dehydrogenase